MRVQRSFRQEPDADTLLRLLYDYIRECGKTGYPHPHRDAALSNYTGLLAEMGKATPKSKPRSPP
jgi:hypothetical protein